VPEPGMCLKLVVPATGSSSMDLKLTPQ